jgi:hypothetical protein
MTNQSRNKVRDWLHTLSSRLGMKSEHIQSAQKPASQEHKRPDQQGYQNPGKDKNHPGDDAAVTAATEPHEGQAAKR